MKKKTKVNKELTCYTVIRKPNGYYSLVRLKVSDYEIDKDFQECTQMDLFKKIDIEFHAMLKNLLKLENKNKDGSVSV